MKPLDVAMIFALLFCLIVDLALGQTLATNVQQQQQGQANSSLPALSERANGLNSRYLSAGSTASLAAATVAAANQAPQQPQQQQQQQQQSQQHTQSHQQHQQLQQHGPGQHQAAHQHQNQHAQSQQQQQQQQQVALAPAIGGGLNGAQQAHQAPLGGLQNPTQYSTATALQVGPQAVLASPQGPLAPVSPVMTSTYAFNPLTGQYGPADASSSLLSGIQQQNFLQNQPFVSQLPGVGGLQQFQQQQQPYLQQQQQQQGFYGPSNNYAVSRSPQRFGGANQGYYQSASNSNYFNQQQPFGRYPQQSAYTRRNGQQALGIGSRNTNYLQGGGGGNQLIDDDSNGLFQQQQVSSGGSLADQLAASLGLNLDPSYVNGNNNGGGNGGYNPSHLQANNFADQQGPFVQQSSSVASSLSLPGGGGSGGGGGGVAQSGAIGNPLLAGADYAANKNDQCIAADGRHGTCYQASECLRRGGTPMGRCGAGQSSAPSNNFNELSGASHVCCLFDVTCGQFAAERFVYFRNPNYPSSFEQSRMCRAKIGKLDKGTCQFRLDLTRFDIAKPTNGNCSQDMFVVSGQNENYVIPKICGLNDGQHYYVGVDESGVITLHMMMMGFYRRSFEILITQIPCRSDFAAPAHCLQYFMGTHGTIKSFNYDDEIGYGPQAATAGGGGGGGGNFVNYDLQQEGSSSGGAMAPYGLQFASGQGTQQLLQGRQQVPIFAAAAQHSNRYGGGGVGNEFALAGQYGGYPNDLDYTICIRKESGFCSITYQLSRTDQGLAPFAVGHSLFGHNDSSGGYGGYSGSGGGSGGGGPATTSGWNSVSTECRDDYLLIGGVRLCSGGGGGGGGNAATQSPSYEQTVQFNQFGQNNSQSNYALQLQQQQNVLMQQLARLQQQQAAGGGGSSSSGNATQNGQPNQQVSSAGNGNNNLEQQQAAIVQQLMLTQQQLNVLAAGGQQQAQQQFVSRPFQEAGVQYSQTSTPADLQGAIITDTTSGPFLLRFVSNGARNARGFHIDYRQNPCK